MIDTSAKRMEYYILNNENLKELGLENVTLDEGVYIVDYKTDEVIYSKGIVNEEGKLIYKLSEM